MSIRILAIESSCDETAASVCCDGNILSNEIAGQEIHRAYGGVVPELASRAHMEHIVPVVDAALRKAGCKPEELHAIAYTQAPGLIGSLLVGAQFAKSMAIALNLPLIAVHHMQAHVMANLIDDPRPAFPFLCLTVSGGHTQIVLCSAPNKMEVLGETRDDAAGEAFDKAAKLLGLPYPGGPLIDQHAQAGNPKRFHFPEPQMPGLQFSFSGVKTALMYFLKAQKEAAPDFVQQNLSDICASVQYTIVRILIHKLEKAVQQTGIREVCIAGGVSANSGLRAAFAAAGLHHGWNTYLPSFAYCTDNAAMIALTAYYKFLEGDFVSLADGPSARASW